MLTLIPWDLDCTIGRYYLPGGIDPRYLAPATHDDHYWGNKLFYRLDSCATGDFHKQVVARYEELRKTYFSLENLTNHYIKLMDMLAKSGAYGRETERWSGDSDLFGQPLDFAAEKEFIKNWLKVRLETFDTYGLPYKQGEAGIHNVYNDKAAGSDIIFNIWGQGLSSIAIPGVYIVNGKKVILKR